MELEQSLHELWGMSNQEKLFESSSNRLQYAHGDKLRTDLSAALTSIQSTQTVESERADVGFLMDVVLNMANKKLPEYVSYHILKYVVDMCPMAKNPLSPECSIWVDEPKMYCSWVCEQSQYKTMDDEW